MKKISKRAHIPHVSGAGGYTDNASEAFGKFLRETPLSYIQGDRIVMQDIEPVRLALLSVKRRMLSAQGEDKLKEARKGIALNNLILGI